MDTITVGNKTYTREELKNQARAHGVKFRNAKIVGVYFEGGVGGGPGIFSVGGEGVVFAGVELGIDGKPDKFVLAYYAGGTLSAGVSVPKSAGPFAFGAGGFSYTGASNTFGGWGAGSQVSAITTAGVALNLDGSGVLTFAGANSDFGVNLSLGMTYWVQVNGEIIYHFGKVSSRFDESQYEMAMLDVANSSKGKITYIKIAHPDGVTVVQKWRKASGQEQDGRVPAIFTETVWKNNRQLLGKNALEYIDGLGRKKFDIYPADWRKPESDLIPVMDGLSDNLESGSSVADNSGEDVSASALSGANEAPADIEKEIDGSGVDGQKASGILLDSENPQLIGPNLTSDQDGLETALSEGEAVLGNILGEGEFSSGAMELLRDPDIDDSAQFLSVYPRKMREKILALDPSLAGATMGEFRTTVNGWTREILDTEAGLLVDPQIQERLDAIKDPVQKERLEIRVRRALNARKSQLDADKKTAAQSLIDSQQNAESENPATLSQNTILGNNTRSIIAAVNKSKDRQSSGQSNPDAMRQLMQLAWANPEIFKKLDINDPGLISRLSVSERDILHAKQTELADGNEDQSRADQLNNLVIKRSNIAMERIGISDKHLNETWQYRDREIVGRKRNALHDAVIPQIEVAQIQNNGLPPDQNNIDKIISSTVKNFMIEDPSWREELYDDQY